ncbi:glutathione S-transferase family protein [Yoonia sp. 208BN28-4]|uniref:glutathione S-transferase family protein n=1 Tax=Yoonia sp. 208BN28-4 TaxID=3126505 RepID=UPI0030AD356A
MTAPLILHFAPDNASLCVRLALTQLEEPFQTRLVDRGANAQKSAAYLALNPNGLIPTLETPDGSIFETAAILLWLADRHEGVAFPSATSPERGPALSQLFWLSNTLHPTLRMLFYPQLYDGNAAFPAATRDTLKGHFAQLNRMDLAWLDRDGPSILACYVGPMIRWCGLYGGDAAWFDLAAYPNLSDFAARFEKTPAMQAAVLAEGLGRTPLTSPSPPNPPEGSAL